ncbi:MAG TPA: response regulator [Candidatus Sulfotelmatobacter sp.]|nr:response regulator [Candidatus Sulfotelmatobacter sp.]
MSRCGSKAKVVLFIGNQPIRLNLTSGFLKQHGWTVLTSGNTHDAIRRFACEHVDIVVLDLNGQGAESVLVASELKRLRPQIPVVVLCSEGRPNPQDASGCADRLVDAEQPDALLSALRDLTA